MNTKVPHSIDSVLSALPLSRRAFLGTLAGGTALAFTDLRSLLAGEIDARPLVVRTHHKDAVSWDYKTGWHGDYVSQPIVDTLVDRGLSELTGLGDVAAAWRALLPGYSRGKKIAVKVNFNNCGSCNDSDNIIDALVEVVNALVRGMTTAGVAEDDIWIYDAVRYIPYRFQNRLRQKSVVCWARNATCGLRRALFSGTALNSVISFTKSIRSQIITDVVVDADYLINIPIVKRHSLGGVTLGYKNHFGSVHNCGDMHSYMTLTNSRFSTTYNPLVEMMANPHLGAKTVLTVADCLYGCLQHQSGTPQPWTMFGNRSPATLLFSRDILAIECVQRDFLFKEASRSSDPKAESYMKLAAQANQGTYEATPTSWNYQLIDYRDLDLAGAGWFRTYGKGKPGSSTRTPFWRFTGVPAPGRTVMLEVVDGIPNSMALIGVGHKEADLPIFFGRLLIDPFLTAFQVPLDASGTAHIPITLPTDPSWVGGEFTLQALVVDSGVSHGVSSTGGLKMHIGVKV